ncbi:SHOCT domain-containing protein [Streptacidiphilus sp. P02-A3a]|uniref:SHOCT domain-containing protein n=1 Tax=Streptacidiphilus sp. P02-A3a TaxID=2704468 RepID=UPI0015F90145|nr:SHOCT domain-containing protein [Streptacidiphilus sp. P02-A3a]QMU69122.1 SHOCT domain-containing protein [Streptacidiphilus sp. P02-A3a]
MDHPVLEAFWMMLWFFLWIMWLFLLFRIVGDLFRDHELSGWWKALWLFGLLVLPFLGVLLYLIVRGRSMTERSVRSAQEKEQQFQAYVRQAAASEQSAGGDSVEQLSKLSELKRNGDLSQAEFDQAKARLLA